MVATAIFSVTMVSWKETAFPLCRATEKRYYYCKCKDYSDAITRTLQGHFTIVTELQ